MTASTVTETDSPRATVDDGAGTASRWRRARFALVLGGVTAFGPLSIDMYLPALPMMSNDLASDPATLQLTLTAFVIGIAVGQLVIGPLSDALGRRKPLLVGIGLYVVASVLCAVSPNVELLIAARALQAIGAAAGMVVARASVRDLFSGIAMTRFFSMLMLVTGLAPILAPVVGGQILTLTSWRGVFLVLTGFGALLLAVVAFALPEPLPPHARRSARFRTVARTYAALLRDRHFLGYALASGLTFAGLFAYISASSFVLQSLYALTPQQYSLVFGANGLGLVLVGQINGRIVGRFAERTLLRTGLLTAAASALAMLAAAWFDLGLAGLLPPLFLLVSTIGLVMPNSTSLALAEHGRTAGSASALLGVLQFAVGGIASPLTGLLGAGSAVPMATIMAGFALLALLAFTTLTRSWNTCTPLASPA